MKSYSQRPQHKRAVRRRWRLPPVGIPAGQATIQNSQRPPDSLPSAGLLIENCVCSDRTYRSEFRSLRTTSSLLCPRTFHRPPARPERPAIDGSAFWVSDSRVASSQRLFCLRDSRKDLAPSANLLRWRHLPLRVDGFSIVLVTVTDCDRNSERFDEKS